MSKRYVIYRIIKWKQIKKTKKIVNITITLKYIWFYNNQFVQSIIAYLFTVFIDYFIYLYYSLFNYYFIFKLYSAFDSEYNVKNIPISEILNSICLIINFILLSISFIFILIFGYIFNLKFYLKLSYII